MNQLNIIVEDKIQLNWFYGYFMTPIEIQVLFFLTMKNKPIEGPRASRSSVIDVIFEADK